MKTIRERGSRLLRGVLVIAAVASVATREARAQHNAMVSCAVDGGTVHVRIRDSAEGLRYWRLEGSSNLVAWTRLGAAAVVDGSGAFDVPLPGGNAGPWHYFRAALDESAANVLNLPATRYAYADVPLPPSLTAPAIAATDNTPADNPVTDPGATLGRVLFYDKALSRNYSLSCASCHQQPHGFSDPEAFSTGFEGGLTGRNSMGLSNARFYGRGHFFWDERAATLEAQVLQPVQNAVEMGMDLTSLVARVQSYGYYTNLFANAFGDTTVTSNRISLALSQFVRSMLTYRSRFDEGSTNSFANFTPQEELGRQIFAGPRGNCATCHGGPNFVGARIENNGLESPFVDLGVGAVTGDPRDNGKFKMSSLRNIERTAPYMHDGRFTTLEQVVDHYSTGVVENVNLGPSLRQPGAPGQPPQARRPSFTPAEKAALVAFLRTLTDDVFLTDPKFSDPFQ